MGLWIEIISSNYLLINYTALWKEMANEVAFGEGRDGKMAAELKRKHAE